jgi:hypothetical protein
MAILSQTVTNSLNLSASPDNEWGVWNWGAFLWLEGTEDLETHTFKWLDAESQASTSQADFSYRKSVTNSQLSTSDRVDAFLKNGDWFYQTPDGTTDYDDQALTTWADSSDPSTSYAESTPPSTDWS